MIEGMHLRRVAATAAALSVPVVLATGAIFPVAASAGTTSTTTTTPGPGTTTVSTTTTTTAGTTTTTGPTTTTVAPTTSTTVPKLSALQELSDAMNAFVDQRAVTWSYEFDILGTKSSEVIHDGVKDGTFSGVSNLGGTVARGGAVLDGKVYLTGNAAGFNQFFGFSKAGASAAVGKWVSVPRASKYYQALSFRLTMGTAVQYLALGRSLESLAPTRVRGLAVNAVRETGKTNGVSLVETVYIRAKGAPLPVEALLSIGGFPATIVYTNWGRPPRAVPPRKSVPLRATWMP
jgi:hypothetical protein